METRNIPSNISRFGITIEIYEAATHYTVVGVSQYEIQIVGV